METCRNHQKNHHTDLSNGKANARLTHLIELLDRDLKATDLHALDAGQLRKLEALLYHWQQMAVIYRDK